VLIAIGILLSRLTGLVRMRIFGYFFGLGAEADAFLAGFRIPNVLQNLFGEGALSASFIPVYASLLARGKREEADRVAGAVASLLSLMVAVFVLVGVLAAPWLITVIAPGFQGSTRELTIQIVRVLFPGTGLLVMSAWCLGILNSHHRFLLSYSVQVIWNVTMIATLLFFGRSTTLPQLAVLLAWGSVAGSALMVIVQLPTVFKVAPALAFGMDTGSADVRSVVGNFLPVFVSKGAVQLSGYIDTLLASLLPTGAMSGLANAQLIYMLPISLFGMSISAAELPAMSGAAAIDPTSQEAVRRRLDAGLRRIAFFVVPSAMAFLALGDIVAAGVLQTGRFRREESVYVWGILAGSAVGLLASTLGRLYSSAYYALRDTRTPLNFAIVRIVLTTVLGYIFALMVPPWLGIATMWGAAGLTASAGMAGWIEMLLLRRTLNSRIGRTGLPGAYILKLWLSAAAGAAVGWAIKLLLPGLGPISAAIVVLGAYGAVFFAVAYALGVSDALKSLQRVRGFGKRSG